MVWHLRGSPSGKPGTISGKPEGDLGPVKNPVVMFIAANVVRRCFVDHNYVVCTLVTSTLFVCLFKWANVLALLRDTGFVPII